jgi:hypothetical protein
MYDEGACMATPALELIERARRDASEARLAMDVAGVQRSPWRSILTAPVRLLRSIRSVGRGG